MITRTRLGAVALGLAAALGMLTLDQRVAEAQEREIKVGYMKNPIQDASLDMMEKWANANNVKLTTSLNVALARIKGRRIASVCSGGSFKLGCLHRQDARLHENGV